MPDWSYRTILRPLLFRLPAATARDLSVGAMGIMGRTALGGAVIDFLGHMRPPATLTRKLMGIDFPAVAGLGSGLDPSASAVGAFARFGVGFVEVGPVTREPHAAAGSIDRSDTRQSIATPDPPSGPGLAAIVRTLMRQRPARAPLLVRLAASPAAEPERATREFLQMIEALLPHASAFTLPATGCDLRALVEAVRASKEKRALVACVPAASPPEEADALADAALAAGVDGLLVDGAEGPAPGRREFGRPSREAALRTVSRMRQRCAPGVVLIAGGGVHEPEDAMGLLEAGANLVVVDSGLVFSGPGLVKRINEAVLYAETGGRAADAVPPATESSWFWSFLMGAGMLLGGVLALAIAATRVILPYDEEMSGLTRAQLLAINDRLLAFMAHDRVTLAGSMITIAILYCALSLFGIRRGLHWARTTVLYSALAGFVSFFLFLGFGYFDPFHAFVTAILFQLFALGAHCRMPAPHGQAPPGLRDDRRWRASQWGQLALIAQSFGFIGAGFMICGVGVTQVFVHEDLEFMRTTREALVAAGPRLIPLVAHDRATFGGMLVVSGVTFLMISLWGLTRGARWLWWSIFLAGLSGYLPALAVHYTVGYDSQWHLAPAWAGLGLFLAAMALLHPYMCGHNAALADSWRKRLERGPGGRPPSPCP